VYSTAPVSKRRYTLPVPTGDVDGTPIHDLYYVITLDFLALLYWIKMDFLQKNTNIQATVMTDQRNSHNSQLPSDRTLNARHRVV